MKTNYSNLGGSARKTDDFGFSSNDPKTIEIGNQKRSSGAKLKSNSIGQLTAKFVGFLALCIALLQGVALGQVSTYTFAQSSGTYTDITGGTLLVTATANTNPGSMDSYTTNITGFPFSFNFNGTGYTGCTVNSNGYITFGVTTAGATATTPISGTVAYNGAVSAWAGDINAMFNIGGRTGTIRWEVVGVAPNREVVVQYKNFRPVYTNSTTNAPFMDFQIRLQETSNVVRVVYGPSGYAIGATAALGTRQIGLRGSTNTDFNNRLNGTGVAFASSVAGTVNNSSQAFNTVTSPPFKPASGLTYAWTPPVPPCPITPSPANAATSVPLAPTLSWGTVTGATGYDVYFGTIPSPTTLVSSNQVGTSFDASALGLSILTQYYWRVVPRNVFGNLGSGCTNWTFTTQGASPTISPSTSSVSFGNYCVNGTGSTLNFTVGATFLTNTTVDVVGSSVFQVSTSAVGPFSTSISLPAPGGTLSNTIVYVRYLPTSLSASAENIVISGGGATDANIAVTGTGVNTYTATATATPSPLCSGASTNLTLLVASSGSANVGAGAGTSAALGISMFPGGWGGSKTQYIIRASELTAAGIAPGNITGLAFEATTSGQAYPGFAMSIGATSNSVMTNSFISAGLTQVFTTGSYTPVIGFNNLTFSSAFNWDGVSNIVVSFCWSTGLTTSTSSTVRTDVVSFVSSFGWQVDSQTPATVCGTNGTPVGGSASTPGTTRPRFRFTGSIAQTPSSISWTESSVVIGSTSPLAVSPASSTSYDGSAVVLGCPVAASPLAVLVTAPLTAPVGTNSTQCGVGIPTASVATGNAQATPSFNWYTASSGGTLLNTMTTYYDNNFSSSLTANGVTGLVAGTPAVPSIISGVLQLTANATSQLGGFRVPGTGVDVDAHQFSFSVLTTAGGADGFSFNFGDDVPTTSGTAEAGAGSKLSVGYSIYASPGISIKYGGATLAFVPGATWDDGGLYANMLIDINTLGQITVSVNGTAVMSNIQLPAAYLSANKSAWSFNYLARTGGIASIHNIDNVVIKYLQLPNNTYPTSISTTTTFYVSELVGSCESPRTPVTVTVNSADALTAVTSVPIITCLGGTTNLTVTQTGSTNTYNPLTWTLAAYPGSGLAGATAATLGSALSITPTAAGTYTYIVTGIDGSCTATATVDVVVNDPIAGVTIAAVATPSIICVGESTSLSAGSTVAPSGYCATTVLASSTSFFNSFSTTGGITNITNNSSGFSANAYGNFTAQSVQANRNATVNFNTVLAGPTVGVALWVDWNQNGTFEGTERMFNTTFYVSAASGSFVVPNTALFGPTRMRIVIDYSNSNPANPCAFVGPGEFEDYTFIVGPTITAFSWSDGSSIVGTTNPLVQTPAVNTTYTATVTANGCPLVTTPVAVTVNPIPLAPTFTNNTVQCGAGIPTVTFAGANAQPIANLNWFDAATGGNNVNPSLFNGAVTTNHYVNDFNTSLTAGSVTGVLTGANSSYPGTLVQLIPNTGGAEGGFRIPATGVDVDAHRVAFDLAVTGATGTNADGMSFVFGDDFVTTGFVERGSGTKLSVCFDIFDAPVQDFSWGLRIKYGNFTLPASTLALNTATPWVTPGGTFVPVIIDIDNAGVITVTVNGTVMVTATLPAAYLSANKASWGFGFLARAGGASALHRIDNLDIKYASLVSATNVLTPIVSSTTYYVQETVAGCTSPRTPVTVTVNPVDPITASVAPTGSICLGASVDLSVAQTGSTQTYALTWTASPAVGSGIPTSVAGSLSSSNTVTPTAAGTYIYSIAGVDGICSSLSTVSVTVINPNAGIVLSASATPNPICAGSSTSLSVNVGGAAPSGYCSTTVIATSASFFTSFATTGGISNITNSASGFSANGYGNFTAMSVQANRGATINFTTGLNGAPPDDGVAIWVDWNQNGTFEAGERMFNTTTYVAAGPSGSFVVPMTALFGATRMRIIVDYNSANPANPCAIAAGRGEFEDYTFIVGPTITAFSWSDGSSIVGTTNPLVQSPSVNTTYTATVTANGCPLVATPVVVTITPLPLAPTFTNNTDLCGPGIPTVTFAGANAQPIANLNWFDAATGGTNVNASTLAGPVTVTHYNNNFSVGLASGVVTGTIAGSASIAASKMQITPPVVLGQLGGFTIPATGVDADAHEFSFALSTSATGSADGMSFNFGDALPATIGTAEQGAGNKLSVCFDVFDLSGPNANGLRIKYGGAELFYSGDVSWRAGTDVPVVIAISNSGLLSLTVNSVVITSSVQLPPAYLSANKSTWTFAFLARSGGIAGMHTIDNVIIRYPLLQSATNLTASISGTTTYYVQETVNGCSSTRTPVTVNVGAAVPFSLSALTTPICAGTPSAPITIATGASDYNTFSWVPAAGVTGDATNGWIFNPSASTNYVLNASQSAGVCLNSAPFALVVNPLPTSITAVPSLTPICVGASISLTGSGASNNSPLQTILSPTGDGGFETGTTFVANGWTATGGNNTWFVGTASVNAGVRAAYISTIGSAGAASTYNQTVARTSHLFRDITIPANATNITLSFNWRGMGEAAVDFLRVFQVATTVTPVTGTAIPPANAITSNLFNQTTWQTVTIPINSSFAGTTQRFVFSWQNDAIGVGFDVPAVIDNVSLTANVLQPLTYSWTSVPTGFTSSAQSPTGVSPTVNTAYTVVASNGFCTAEATTNVVVNVLPTAAITSLSQQLCYGNTPAIAGTITATGAYTLTLSDGSTATGTGTGNWSIPVAPTVATTYTVTNIVDANGCPLGVVSGNPTLTPAPTPTADLSPTASATCVVTGDSWTHFYTSAGKLVVSIKGTSVAADLGAVTADAFVNADAQVSTACADPAATTFQTALLGRNWHITPTNDLPAIIRLPITDAEVTALVAKSATTAVNPNDDVFSITDINLSKYNGLNENGNWQDNCNPLDSTSFATSELYIMQAGNGAITIANGFVETIGGSSFIEFSIPGFSEFWLMNSLLATPLPVNLTSFAASCEEKEIAVKWTTATEQNSQSFIIERSRDLAIWEFVSEVVAAGNSSSALSYATADANPLSGITYYRMKQIDLNGVQKIYGPISVSCGDIENSMIVFPNPTKGNFTVEISSDENVSDAQIQITDLTGKIINERITNILEGKNQFSFEGLDLQLGTYIINLKIGNGKINPVRVVVN